MDDISKIQNLRTVSNGTTNWEHEFELKWHYYFGTEGVKTPTELAKASTVLLSYCWERLSD